jgi:hypothetical protein
VNEIRETVMPRYAWGSLVPAAPEPALHAVRARDQERMATL